VLRFIRRNYCLAAYTFGSVLNQSPIAMRRELEPSDPRRGATSVRPSEVRPLPSVERISRLSDKITTRRLFRELAHWTRNVGGSRGLGDGKSYGSSSRLASGGEGRTPLWKTPAPAFLIGHRDLELEELGKLRH